MRIFFLALGGAILGTILAIVIMIFAGFAVLGSIGQPEKLPDDIVLTLDLRESLPDQAPIGGLSAFFGQEGFLNVLTKLDAAVDDERVKGVYVRASEFGIGSSRAEELRAAFLKLQAADKFVIAHSQGSFGGGPSGYRALSAADELWIQPGSEIIAGGITFETLFLKGLLERLSISPQIEALYEYKNAPNGYKEEDYTEPHREAMTRLAESVWTVSLTDIATDREIGIEDARAALEASPLEAEQLVALNLADHTGWPRSAVAAIRDRVSDDAAFIDMATYTPPTSAFSSPVIAIVGGEGPITTGWADESPFGNGNAGISSDTVASAILEAAENERVQAIVFRVDSPGGSPVASDQIWNAVEVAKTEYNKPVVVSMGSVAASGGYYVATGADWIVANRTTITGSIGIFGGKMAFAEGLARIGVNVRTISVGGPFSGALTSADVFTDDQQERLHAWLKRGYDRFLLLVSEGRNMTVPQVHERARGRVWSGEDALDQGLVDELGGVIIAIEKARELAQIDPESDVRLLMYPMPSAGFPFGGSFASTSSADLSTLSQLSDILGDPRMQALLEEFESTQSGQIQARLPVMIER